MSSSGYQSPNPAPSLSRIGSFSIGPEIGKGSFAVVHKGRRIVEDDSNTPPIEVAIKIVTRKKLTQKLLDNLEGEISILKRVSHPNIVELIDCLKTDTHIHLIMDFASGGDLSQYIKRKGTMANEKTLPRSHLQAARVYPHPMDGGLNEEVARSFLEQLASAMEFMRVRNIVHRDLKPQNLLLQPPSSVIVSQGHPLGIPQLKVADFGFARSLPAASLAETLCGSPLYMAPEILRYEKYDAKADLWSIGAVSFEMVVGKPPFRASNHVELLRRIERNEDKIKFPDERSEATWLREVQRRREAGETVSDEEERNGPTKISLDVKTLIRGLLKRKPLERMSFEDFFSSPVIIQARPSKQREPLSASPQSRAPEMLPMSPASPLRPTPGPSLPVPLTPSSRVQAPAPLLHPAPLPKFRSKYLVARNSDASSPQPAKVPSADNRATRVSSESSKAAPQSSNTTPAKAPSTTHTTSSPPPAAKEDEEDSQYVLVEKRNIEVNALADELAYSPVSPSRPSVTARLARGPSAFARLRSEGAIPSPTEALDSPATPQSAQETSNDTSKQQAVQIAKPPASRESVSATTAPISSSPSAPFALPIGMRRQSFGGRRLSVSANRTAQSSSPTADQEGPLPSEEVERGSTWTAQRLPLTISAVPGSALSRALSSASQKLFGIPAALSVKNTASLVRRPGLIGSTSGQHVRGASVRSVSLSDDESALLHYLDDLSQKAFVLCEFADSRLSSICSEGPHQPSWYSSAPGSTSPRMDRHRSPSLSSSTVSSHAHEEMVAHESLSIYLKSMSFLQKGIEGVKAYLDRRCKTSSSSVTISSEVNEAVQHLRKRFNETFERADFARGKCVESNTSASTTNQTVNKLIYDKAMEIARAAALDELENNHSSVPIAPEPSSASPSDERVSTWDVQACLLAYETAAIMLGSLLEPAKGAGSGEGEEGEADSSLLAVEPFITSISHRCEALRTRLPVS